MGSEFMLTFFPHDTNIECFSWIIMSVIPVIPYCSSGFHPGPSGVQSFVSPHPLYVEEEAGFPQCPAAPGSAATLHPPLREGGVALTSASCASLTPFVGLIQRRRRLRQIPRRPADRTGGGSPFRLWLRRGRSQSEAEWLDTSAPLWGISPALFPFKHLEI